MLNGREYRFTGLNIYNANSRNNCWYSLGNDDGALDKVLTDIGPVTAFRAWFFQRLATTNGTRDWAAFDRTLVAARARGLKVIVTLADQWGACEDDRSAIYKTEAWYKGGYLGVQAGALTSYREWVREVVTRYRDDATILAWQLMNEAETMVARGGECSPASVLKTWATDMATVVKSIDSRHLLSLGTMGSGQCGSVYLEYESLHSIPAIDLCEYHDYALGAMPGDQWNGLAFRLEQCAALDKPLFVGEVGISLAAANGDRQRRADLLSAKVSTQRAAGVVGHSVWAWSDPAQHLYEDLLVTTGDPLLGVLQAQ